MPMAKESALLLLRVPATASFAEIKSAYGKLALTHHPDKPGGNVEMMKLLNEAIEVLRPPRDVCDDAPEQRPRARLRPFVTRWHRLLVWNFVVDVKRTSKSHGDLLGTL